jgi:uncharacterized protein (TIGR02145 family)
MRRFVVILFFPMFCQAQVVDSICRVDDQVVGVVMGKDPCSEVDKVMNAEFDCDTSTQTPLICGVDSVLYYGKYYHTILWGDQCWFKENLNVGTMIDASVEQSYTGEITKYCYDNDEDNCTSRGGLYQFWGALRVNPARGNGFYYQGTMLDGTKGVCPTGWHIPSKDDLDYLGQYGGRILKSRVFWDEEDDGRGFNAIPTGLFCDTAASCNICDETQFSDLNFNTTFMTTTIELNYSDDCMQQVFWARGLSKATDDFYTPGRIYRHFESRIIDGVLRLGGYAASIRCIKDN